MDNAMELDSTGQGSSLHSTMETRCTVALLKYPTYSNLTTLLGSPYVTCNLTAHNTLLDSSVVYIFGCGGRGLEFSSPLCFLEREWSR